MRLLWDQVQVAGGVCDWAQVSGRKQTWVKSGTALERAGLGPGRPGGDFSRVQLVCLCEIPRSIHISSVVTHKPFLFPRNSG